MKIIKKISAAILVLVMAAAVIGCHKKNEVAVTIDGQEFTSAYYMCAFINSYSEGLNLAYETLTEEQQKTATTETMLKQKIEGKDFNTWAKENAIESLKEIAYYKSMCQKNKLDYTKDELAQIEYQAEYSWTNYDNYGTTAALVYEPNGVSLETYKKFTVDAGYSTLYFKHLYGENGEKEIPIKDVKKELYTNNILVNVLQVDFYNNESDEERDEVKKKLESYAKKIKDGKKTFAQVYNEYYNIKESDLDTEISKDGPKDAYAQVIDSTFDYFTDVKKMDIGDIKVIENEYQTTVCLVIKQDIKKDPYYLKTYDLSLRQTLKFEEFTAEASKAAAKLTADINDYAVKRFKVKDIKEPEYAAPIY